MSSVTANLRLAAAAAGLALAGCAHQSVHFRPVLAEEALPGQPDAAQAEAAGVRFSFRVGDWRGWPEDLEDQLTPVEVVVDNQSGHALRVGHRHFGLVAPNGFEYRAMSPSAVQHVVEQSYSAGSPWYYGYYGAYPWPGFHQPWDYDMYPYLSWGFPGPVGFGWELPPPTPQVPQAGPSGTLQSGGHVSVLIFFQIPARKLPSLELTAELVDRSGARFGSVRVPLVRWVKGGAAAPPGAPPSSPPPPPPGTPPPAPPPPPDAGKGAG